jgi:Bacterial conjugation TrbI-like protein
LNNNEHPAGSDLLASPELPTVDELAESNQTASIQRAGKKRSLRIPIFASVILIAVSIMTFAVVRANKSEPPQVASTVPAQEMRNVPGDTKATPAYDNKQIEANLEDSRSAKQDGVSHVPTLVGKDNVAVIPMPDPAPVNTVASFDPLADEVNARMKRIQEYFNREEAGLREQSARAPHTVVFNIEPATVKQATKESETPKGIAIIEGSTVQARIERTVDTDHPGDVHAIVIGDTPLAGVRLVGAPKVEQNKVSLQFTRMVSTSSGQVVTTSARAFDPSNTSYGIATEIDRHILQRYGGLILASLAKATPTLLAPQVSTTQQLVSGALTQTTQRASEKDIARGVAADAIGQIGNDIATEAKRPITIRVAQDELIGVVFTQATTIPYRFQEQR